MSKDSPSKFIPNSFQHPNAYVDEYMYLLTGDECKVLDYAVRRIFGFGKRQDRISVSQFCDGIISKDGVQLDHGTGLSEKAVKKYLSHLVKFGLMLRLAENDPNRNRGVLWGLQLDSEKVNLIELEKRQVGIDKLNRRRVVAASKKGGGVVARPQGSSHDPRVVARPEGGVVARPEGGVVARPPQNTVETQGNPDHDAAVPRKAREADLHFEALADLTGLTPPFRDWKKLTRTSAGQLNRYAKELRDVGATPEQIAGFKMWFSKRDWRGREGQAPTPADVVKLWSQYLNGANPNGTHRNSAQQDPERIAHNQRIADEINRRRAERKAEARAGSGS